VHKFIVLTAFVVAASPAFATSWVETSNCRYSRFYGFHQCTRTLTEIVAPARDPERERQEAQAREAEAVKWEAFCKPTFHLDEYGMHRASYAHSGCEFGRSE
jgi:hypothetical protein